MTSVDELWTESMNTGVELIDGHHRTLLGLACDTRNALDAGADRERIKEILSGLIAYTKYHFLAEERVMLDSGYPRLEAQRKSHAYFVRRLEESFLSLSEDRVEFARRLLDFLREWFVEHVVREDKLIGAYLASRRDEGRG